MSCVPFALSPLAVLQRHWGHQTFRPRQEEAIHALLERKDLLVLMPTGGGKSICFQVPALIKPGVAIVVSPLIALMQDQVAQLRRRGIAATALHGGMTLSMQDIVLDNCIYGKTKLLYVAPERLLQPLFLARVAKMCISFLAVDEAHCIVSWGYDFRPAYRGIAAFREQIGRVPVIALTATATFAVQDAIIQSLCLKNPVRLVMSFARANLSYRARCVVNKERMLLRWLHRIPSPAIVYASTRVRTEQLAEFLTQEGIGALAYHAGFGAEEREARHQAWLAERDRVMVATNAFGMGIDKSNVRLVVHMGLPSSLEAYYQEAGRAGRDGERAYAVALYDDRDLHVMAHHLGLSHPGLDSIRRVYQSLANYYQVAVGSHDLTGYPFDLEDFASTYGYHPRMVHHALRRLADVGVIRYDEDMNVQAEVGFTLSFQEMYTFRLAYPAYDALFDALLERCALPSARGVGKISLPYLAKRMGKEEGVVARMLEDLGKQGALAYVPAKRGSNLAFLVPRCLPAHLPLSVSMIKTYQRAAQKRFQALRHYVTHCYRCRSQLLLEYFGEVTYDRCHLCDLCKQQKEKGIGYADDNLVGIRQAILCALRSAPSTLPDLFKEVAVEGEEKAWTAVVREMLEEGIVVYDSAFHLTIPK